MKLYDSYTIPISVFAEIEVPSPCSSDSRLVASMIVQLPTAAVEARDELSFNNPVRIHINNTEVRIDEMMLTRNIDIIIIIIIIIMIIMIMIIIIYGNDSGTVDENGVDP